MNQGSVDHRHWSSHRPQRRFANSVFATLALGVLVLWQTGCSQEEEIRRYSAAKEETADPHHGMMAKAHGEKPAAGVAEGPAEPGRMLAAVIPQGEQAWFFKVVGAKDAVTEQVEAFRALLKSVKFADGKPKWTAPPGWREKAGSGMRFATLLVGPEDKPLEVTVIPLAITGGSEAEYVLSNVNRWRQQMGLAAIPADQLAANSEQIKLDGAVATVVDLEGARPTGMSR